MSDVSVSVVFITDMKMKFLRDSELWLDKSKYKGPSPIHPTTHPRPLPQWVLNMISRLFVVAFSVKSGTCRATRSIDAMLGPSRESSSPETQDTFCQAGSDSGPGCHTPLFRIWLWFLFWPWFRFYFWCSFFYQSETSCGPGSGTGPTFYDAVVAEVQVEQEAHVQQRQHPTQQEAGRLANGAGQQCCHLNT